MRDFVVPDGGLSLLTKIAFDCTIYLVANVFLCLLAFKNFLATIKSYVCYTLNIIFDCSQNVVYHLRYFCVDYFGNFDFYVSFVFLELLIANLVRYFFHHLFM